MSDISVTSGAPQAVELEPGATGAFACFGSWENSKTCYRLSEVEDPLDGCSQSIECRRYTLEQNPPTTRFSVKPRRDGRFEIQQFRDFIQEQTSYDMAISRGEIVITYPGDRGVPKSKRFFLHVKNIEQAELNIDKDFELIMSLEKMVLRQAGSLLGGIGGARPSARREEDDPEARRRRIAEKLRQKASEEARKADSFDDELDLELDIDLDEDDDDLDIDEIDLEEDVDDEVEADDDDDDEADAEVDVAVNDDLEVFGDLDAIGPIDDLDEDSEEDADDESVEEGAAESSGDADDLPVGDPADTDDDDVELDDGDDDEDDERPRAKKKAPAKKAAAKAEKKPAEKKAADKKPAAKKKKAE